jgi:hypothetical protein
MPGNKEKYMKAINFACFVTAVCACLNMSPASAETDEELAKKLSNPIASLISVPFQYNYDSDYGLADDGKRSFINIQPVIPFDLNPKWNLITRTILPVIDQDDVPSGSGGKSGIGDVVQSLFFSPKAPTADGVIWGVGPVLLLPTASDELLGGEQWGLGPTGVALKQQGPWTYGVLANHIWSVAGDDDRVDLQLGSEQVVGTDQPDGHAADESWRSACQHRWRCTLLGARPGRWTGRLGCPPDHDPAVPKIRIGDRPRFSGHSLLACPVCQGRHASATCVRSRF